MEKSKQHHKKPPPIPGPEKSNGRPLPIRHLNCWLAGGRIIMHAIYRGRSRRVNEREGDTGHRNCGTQRELSVVLNRFQNLLLKSIISRGWCVCGGSGSSEFKCSYTQDLCRGEFMQAEHAHLKSSLGQPRKGPTVGLTDSNTDRGFE